MWVMTLTPLISSSVQFHTIRKIIINWRLVVNTFFSKIAFDSIPDVCLEYAAQLLDGLVVLQDVHVLARLVDDVVPHLGR